MCRPFYFQAVQINHRSSHPFGRLDDGWLANSLAEYQQTISSTKSPARTRWISAKRQIKPD